MPIPKGLRYKNGIAKGPDGKRYYACCQRGGHRVFHVAFARKDAEAWLSKHVAAEHLGYGRSTTHAHRFGESLDAFMEHVEKLEALGKRSALTVAYYKVKLKALREHFSPLQHLEMIEQEDVRKFVFDRFKQERTNSWTKRKTRTKGHSVIRELEALRTIYRHFQVKQNWRIPFDDIRAEKIPKRELSIDEIRKFVKALPVNSPERGLVLLKLRTGMRNAEINSLLVSDVDLGSKPPRVRFMRRAKRKTRPDWFQLAPDAAEALGPLVVGRNPEHYLFSLHDDGRAPQRATFEFRLTRASKAAGISPPLRRIGVLRNTAITAATIALGMASASLAWHDSDATTRGYLQTRAEEDVKQKVVNALYHAIQLTEPEESGTTLETDDHAAPSETGAF